MNNKMQFNWVRWLLISILVSSIICLIIVYLKGYIPEFHSAMSMPFAIIVGLTTIAVAIYEKM